MYCWKYSYGSSRCRGKGTSEKSTCYRNSRSLAKKLFTAPSGITRWVFVAEIIGYRGNWRVRAGGEGEYGGKRGA